MLALVSASFQGIRVQQVCLGGSEASYTASGALTQLGTPSKVAQVCQHQGWDWNEHSL